MGADTYQIGNALFNHVHAFLNSCGQQGDRTYKLTLTFPTKKAQQLAIRKLQQDSPPWSGEFSTGSAAQHGNSGGYWQNLEYEFVVSKDAS